MAAVLRACAVPVLVAGVWLPLLAPCLLLMYAA